jgi:hypothetical protein
MCDVGLDVEGLDVGGDDCSEDFSHLVFLLSVLNTERLVGET